MAAFISFYSVSILAHPAGLRQPWEGLERIPGNHWDWLGLCDYRHDYRAWPVMNETTLRSSETSVAGMDLTAADWILATEQDQDSEQRGCLTLPMPLDRNEKKKQPGWRR